MLQAICLTAIFLSASLITNFALPAFCHDETQKSVRPPESGQIVSVNTESLRIILKKIKDPAKGTYVDIPILLAPETRLYKENTPVKLDSLNVDDMATVYFINDIFGKERVDLVVIVKEEKNEEKK